MVIFTPFVSREKKDDERNGQDTNRQKIDLGVLPCLWTPGGSSL